MLQIQLFTINLSNQHSTVSCLRRSSESQVLCQTVLNVLLFQSISSLCTTDRVINAEQSTSSLYSTGLNGPLCIQLCFVNVPANVFDYNCVMLCQSEANRSRRLSTAFPRRFPAVRWLGTIFAWSALHGERK